MASERLGTLAPALAPARSPGARAWREIGTNFVGLHEHRARSVRRNRRLQEPRDRPPTEGRGSRRPGRDDRRGTGVRGSPHLPGRLRRAGPPRSPRRVGGSGHGAHRARALGRPRPRRARDRERDRATRGRSRRRSPHDPVPRDRRPPRRRAGDEPADVARPRHPGQPRHPARARDSGDRPRRGVAGVRRHGANPRTSSPLRSGRGIRATRRHRMHREKARPPALLRGSGS